MKIFSLLLTTILFLAYCTKSTEPEPDSGKFVVDKQELSVNKYFEDSTLFYDTNFTFIYHLENESGNLLEYRYGLYILPNGFGTATGWDDRRSRSYRGRTSKFREINEKDTLAFNLRIGTRDTLAVVGLNFYIQGYYFDEPKFLFELEDEQNLDAFFYFYEDTLY